MSRISVRGFAVASATAVTTVGAVVGVASGNPQPSNQNLETTAADATLLTNIPMGQQAPVQVSSLAQQADAQAAAADTSARKAAEEDARVKAAQSAKDKRAAADAEAKKAAEAKERAEKEKREREERKKAEERASRDAARSGTASFAQQSSYTVAQVQSIARQIIPSGQFQCFSNIVQRESTWNYKAQNPSSGAYGLVQALPGTKMASAGADWRTNPATQIKWGLNYMNERYGSPCGAWSFWQANRWY
ncbi:transglycosylase SLT domain-containing protein [Streptomyces clavuligerus]|uniref:aggregation-promoting factor C-terminal-like domain-containing protein n=1 Tax=Streptomyces clavuligerus TaxID=1901 RepID=UPI0001851D67|nr:transglycosylase SLT domain-containing protein [Streptomyces clavuligerus]ANW18370.1 transglycosylase domain-containing protein [Streptomyces clavuligerus]AXU12927.1 lytic transglycosylase domain-containing protein [Streptomyces clavuligerus]MBY6302852.1 transglycosylase SLT domain-containing protein [Streptomyces clavuligerus]QCS05711.1 lytic transglycosylase domain-containing protein [Streptomyces clavuligerus]QPJ94923.1 transglycosylase SLT domain-containing protein [Streptomyces clavuli